MSLVSDLEATRALVAAGWIQGRYAAAANCDPRGWADPDACKFCILGAIRRVAGTRINRRTLAISEAIRNSFDARVEYLDQWQDEPQRTQAEVVAVLDRTIAIAKQKELA